MQTIHSFVFSLCIGFPIVWFIEAPIPIAAPNPIPPAANAPATPLWLFAAPSYTSNDRFVVYRPSPIISNAALSSRSLLIFSKSSSGKLIDYIKKFATVNPYFSNSGIICSLTLFDRLSSFVEISNAEIPFVMIASAIADFAFITRIPL